MAWNSARLNITYGCRINVGTPERPSMHTVSIGKLNYTNGVPSGSALAVCKLLAENLEYPTEYYERNTKESIWEVP